MYMKPVLGRLHQVNVEAKRKKFFDVCRLSFDLFHFRFHFRLGTF